MTPPPWHSHATAAVSAAGALLLDLGRAAALEESTDLGLLVAAVPAQRADRRELACLCPPSDRLGIDTEHRGDLSRREQRLGVCGLARGHGSSLPATWPKHPGSSLDQGP